MPLVFAHNPTICVCIQPYHLYLHTTLSLKCANHPCHLCVNTTMPLLFAHNPVTYICTRPCRLCVHTTLPLVCAHNPTICVCTQTQHLCLYTNLQPDCVHSPANCVCSVHTTIQLKCAHNPPTCVCTQICHLCLHTTLQYMKMNTKEKPYTDFEILSCINDMENEGLIMTSNDTIFFLKLYLEFTTPNYFNC